MQITTSLTIQKTENSLPVNFKSDWTITQCYNDNGTLVLWLDDLHSHDRIRFAIKNPQQLTQIKDACEKTLVTKTVNQNG